MGSDRGIEVPSWRRGSEGMTSTKQPFVFTPARASSMHSLVTPNTDVRYPEFGARDKFRNMAFIRDRRAGAALNSPLTVMLPAVRGAPTSVTGYRPDSAGRDSAAGSDSNSTPEVSKL